MKVKNYLFFSLLLSCMAIFLFNSCSEEGTFSELETESEIESRRVKFETSADCIISPSGNEFQLVTGETQTLSGSNSTQGPNQYSWSVANSDCIQIVGSNSNSTVTVVAVGSDCTSLVNLVITNLATGQETRCNVIVIVSVPSQLNCCFEFWEVPKWFPICFGECTGNLDHVAEVHHKVCDGSSLPAGFTTSIHDMQLSSTTTFGNCYNCANPISSLPNDEGGSSVNLSICGPLNHSMLIDIAIRDANGNIVHICEDNYFSFFVPECDDKGGF